MTVLPYTISVDFDGTLVDHLFPYIGQEVPGAFKWLRRFQAAGARLILNTMRSDGRDDGSTPLTDAVKFCRKRKVEFWAVNDNPEQAVWTSSRKIYAHVYIDDAAFGCPMWLPSAFFRSPVVHWDLIGPKVLDMILSHNEASGD